MLLTDAWGGYRKHEDSKTSCTTKEPRTAKTDEPLSNQQADPLLAAKTEVAEEALLEASYQNFQLNMDALDAYCRMADAAMRHANDPAFYSDGINENQLI